MQNNRKISYGILIVLITLALILLGIIWHEKNSPLNVIFLNIGQGDSILISQGSQQLLIDGGKDGKLLLEKLGKYVPFWDRKIEAVIETHPDQDHIGGLIDVIGVYGIDFVLKTKMESQSQTFKELEGKIVKNGIEKIEAKSGVKIKFTGGAIAEIIYPFKTISDVNGQDTNMHSVIVMLAVGENKFLLTGDLPTTEENKLLDSDADLKADFLKIAHHGSKYATSSAFLDSVKPVNAIISVGKNNSYGHPNQEVLKRLAEHRINVLRTDEIGDIKYECFDLKSKCHLVGN